jgi:hypothetical protein
MVRAFKPKPARQIVTPAPTSQLKKVASPKVKVDKSKKTLSNHLIQLLVEDQSPDKLRPKTSLNLFQGFDLAK